MLTTTRHALRNQCALWLALLALFVSFAPAHQSAQEPSYQLYVGTSGIGETAAEIYQLAPDGTWQRQRTMGAPEGRDLQMQDFSSFKERLYAATHSTSGPYGHVYFTSDGTNWIDDSTFPAGDVFALSTVGERLYAGVPDGLYELKKIWNSFQWTFLNVAFGNVNRVVAFGGKLYAGTHGLGLYVSSNSGATWRQVDGFPHDGNVWAMTVFQNKLYIGTYNGQFYGSVDGVNWSQIAGLEAAQGWAAFAVFGERLIAIAGENCELFQSTDGTNWQKLEPSIGLVQVVLAVKRSGGDRLYAGSGQQLRFTDDSVTWTALPPLPRGNLSALGVRLLPAQ